MDKKEAVSEIKKQVKEKWQRKYVLSEKTEIIQEIFSEVGKRNCCGEGDRRSFSILNQLLSGHTRLNNHRAKIDKTASLMCDMCKVPEDTEHYLFHCDAYQEERDTLEKTVEEVLNREGLNSDITLKVPNGSIDGRFRVVSALGRFGLGRFCQFWGWVVSALVGGSFRPNFNRVDFFFFLFKVNAEMDRKIQCR